MKKRLAKICFLTFTVIGVVFASSLKAEAASLGYGIYCKDVNGRARCSVDSREVISYTGRVIVNGWVNYGPWYPRPGFGVIIP